MAEPEEVAAALRVSIGMLVRTLRQAQTAGDLTLPESSALARLDRGGATSAADLARAEQISPQSLGATLADLDARGLIARTPDPADGRRAVVAITAAGRRALIDRRNGRVELLARGLADGFTTAELDRLLATAPLLERLAQRL
jgi:DNA-binding MarR family transcriptional regulator